MPACAVPACVCDACVLVSVQAHVACKAHALELVTKTTVTRPWDWLPCDWIRPITNEATSKTRQVRPWDWLPCDWLRPITKEATSKTHPPYDSLQTTAMASSFLRLPSPMGLMALKHRGKTATFGFLSRLYSLAGLELRDRRDCWSFGVSFLFVPCPLK